MPTLTTEHKEFACEELISLVEEDLEVFFCEGLRNYCETISMNLAERVMSDNDLDENDREVYKEVEAQVYKELVKNLHLTSEPSTTGLALHLTTSFSQG